MTDQALAYAADAVFLLPQAEYVTYHPHSGPARRIRAVIQRYDEDEPIDGFGGGSRPAAIVLVKNNNTDGISSAKLDTGRDKIEMAIRLGAVPKKVRIVEKLAADAGFVRLRCQ